MSAVYLHKLREKLPEHCYVLIPGPLPSITIGVVRFGEVGFFPASVQGFDFQSACLMIAQLNGELEVTDLQVDCMREGALSGWGSPMADPDVRASILAVTEN